MAKKKIFLLLLLFITIASGCSPRDTSPPQVYITQPQDGQNVSGIINVQAVAIDSSGISKVEFYIDNTNVGEDRLAPYEYSWDTDTLQNNSQHTIKAKAYDIAGNLGESSIVTVTVVDNKSPQITIITPQNGENVFGTVLIKADVIDKSSGKIEKAPSGVEKVQFYIDNMKVAEDNSSPYEYSWDTAQENNGNHLITVKAFDLAGNNSFASINVNVNNIPGPSYVESSVSTYYDFFNTISQKDIELLLQNNKINPRLKEVIKNIYIGKTNRSSLKNINPIKSLVKGKTSNLPPGYHINLGIWWSEVPNATEYHVYLSYDGKNYIKVADVSDTYAIWSYADQDLELEVGNIYRVKVSASVGFQGNIQETLATIGSWDIKVLDPVILTSPSNGELNIPKDQLSFIWQNPQNYYPLSWNIDVCMSHYYSGWHYWSNSFQTSIEYNYDGFGEPLYPGTVYNWYVGFYDTWTYSKYYNENRYFSISTSPFYSFQTSASDYVKINWLSNNNDLDLYVKEPNGNTYYPYNIFTPNGIFVGDEPQEHNFNFEQYSFLNINTATPGNYIFSVHNKSSNSEYLTILYELLGMSDFASVNIGPNETIDVLIFNKAQGIPSIKILSQNK